MSKLRAGRTFPYQLESERGNEDADTFHLKVLSGEGSDAVSELCAKFRQGTDKEHRLATMSQVLEMTVASWPWEGSLRSVLTDRECWELVAGATQGAALTVEERKKFVSLHSSETDSSATAAEATAT